MSTTSISSHTVGSSAGVAGTTAQVLEYLCLFTHDLRRKQKRWQDGRLKYHTFNRRVMAYDDRGNFIGDMHWRADWLFDTGEEIQLERGGIIVQVSDCVGQQSQDPSELVDKRVQEKEQRSREKEQRLARAVPSRPSGPIPRRDTEPHRELPGASTPHIHHRPLTTVIGTPTGHHGRAAVPSVSPFEQRRKVEEIPTSDDASRPAKRRRYDDTPPSKMGYAQSLFGTTLTLSGAPPSSAVRLPTQPLLGQTLPRISHITAPMPPCPESSECDTVPVVSPPKRDSTGGPRPLATMDDRRTNSLPSKSLQHVVTGSATKRLVPLRKTKNNEPSDHQQQTRPASPRNDIDLTLLSDNEDDAATPQIARDIPVCLPPIGISRIFAPPTGPVIPASSASDEAEPMESMPDNIIDTSNSSVPNQPGGPAMSSRCTTLRLRAGRKRGLLLVSEQPLEKPTEVAEGENTASVEQSDLSSVYFRGPSSQNADTSIPECFASSQEQKEDRPADSPIADATYTIQAVEEQVDVAEETVGSVSKSRRKSKRGKGAIMNRQADETAEEPQREPKPPRRSRKDAADLRPRASTATADTKAPGDDTPEGSGIAPLGRPRIVKFAKRSVRSKELIGFSFDNIGPSTRNGSLLVSTLHPRQKLPPMLDVKTHDIGAAESDDVGSASPLESACGMPEELPEEYSFASRLDSPPPDMHHSSPPSLQHPQRPSSPGIEDPIRLSTPFAEKEDYIAASPGAGKLEREVVKAATVVSEDIAVQLPKTTASGGISKADDVRQERPRLANPATRGRKAALKSHAAGQMPQPVLPAETGLQIIHVVSRERDDAGGDTTTRDRVRPKIEMTFPGFAPAKVSGPWSREAHDLLETGRPD